MGWILFIAAAAYILCGWDDCFLNEYRHPDPDAGKEVKPIYVKRF